MNEEIENDLIEAVKEVKRYDILKWIVGRKLARKILGWKTAEEVQDMLKDLKK
jgi:UDP-glucose 4-epimerase